MPTMVRGWVIKSGEGGEVGARGDVGGLQVFVEEEIAEGVDLALAEGVGYFGDGLAFKALVVGALEVGEPDVAPGLAPGSDLLPEALAALVGAEDFFEAGRASVVGPLGEHDEDPGAAVGVGEAVHGHVLAGVDGAVNQFEELSGAAGVGDALVEVGQVAGEARPLADLQGLLDGVEEPVAEGVAKVGVIDAAESGDLLGEADEFVGGGVAAGRVVEARGDAESALLHALSQHGSHVGDVGVGGGGVVPAHGADADG